MLTIKEIGVLLAVMVKEFASYLEIYVFLDINIFQIYTPIYVILHHVIGESQ